MKKDDTCPLVNGGELARIFGVSRRAITKWQHDGLPRSGRLYEVAECVQWRIRTITEKAADEPNDVMEARKRLYIAQEQKTRLEVERLKYNLVDREEAESLLMRIGATVAAQLDAVGPRLAAIVAPMGDHKEIQLLLFEEHRAVRESIANAIMELPAFDRGDSPPATDADSGRVGGSESDSAA